LYNRNDSIVVTLQNADKDASVLGNYSMNTGIQFPEVLRNLLLSSSEFS